MKNNFQNKTLKILMTASFSFVIVLFLSVPMQVIIDGARSMKSSIFSLGGGLFSVFPSMINTLFLVIGVLLLAVPISLFAAMFLWFYEHHIPRFVHCLQALIDSLGAVPSIVYALFGMIFFVSYMSFGFSLISGILTMTILILPVLIRASEQALHAIPEEVYLSGISLGLSKFYVMCNVLLPQAYRGILSGIVLAVGRIVGESAALIFTMGTAAGVVSGLGSSGRTMAVQMYALTGEGQYIKYAYATSLVLLLFVIFLRILSMRILGRRGVYE